MAGIKISQLPAVGTPALTDLSPEVQPATGGTTYKMTWQQLLNLYQPSIVLTYAGNPNGNVAGTIYQFLYDTTDDVLYICTTTGNAAAAVWTSQGGSGSFLPLAGGTMSGNIAMGAHAVTGMQNPVNPQDAATKLYVDNIATGGGAPCYAASTANLTVTQAGAGVGATLTNAGAQATFTLDSATPPLNSRVLIKNQSTNTQNGVYTVTNVGSNSTNWVLTRATDYDTPQDINATGMIPIENGSTNASTGWINTTTMVTVDTTAVTFVQFGIPVPVPLNQGGTNASLTASAGGIFYSTASAGALSAAGSAGQLFRSTGTTAPGWTTSTYPTTNAANTLLYASSANTMAALATANSSVLVTDGSGVPSLSTTLPSGLAATNMALTTPNIGVATASSITFGGSALSNYVSNTSWTPVFTFATLGNLSVSYSSQTGFYTRIGSMLFFQFLLICTPTFTTSSGVFQITGLPVAANGNSFAPGSIFNSTGITYGSGLTHMVCAAVNSQSYLQLTLSGSNTTAVNASTTNFSSGSAVTLIGAGFYFI